MRRTVPPSAEIEEQIDQLLAVGVGENPRESLSSLAKLGARLIIQRAVEDEFDAWLGRARYDRRPDYQRGLQNYQSGLRNGFRPRKLQTADGVAPVSTTLERFRSQAGESEVQVPRTRPPYPEEFRREAIRLAQLGDKPQRKLAKDLGISEVTLRNWLKQEKAERGERPSGLSHEEREELQQLRNENAKLRMEREILSKAAVFFAKESDGR